MFEGSKNVKEGEFDTLLEGAGGNNNGSTNDEWRELHHRRSRERAGAGALPQVDRMAYSTDVSPARRRSARCHQGQERRQSYEIVRTAVAGGHRARFDAVAGEPSLQLADDRVHGGPHRTGRVCDNMIQLLKSAARQQRQPVDCRRYRLRSHTGTGPEVVWRRSGGNARRTSRASSGADSPSRRSPTRYRKIAACLRRVADAAGARAGRRRPRRRQHQGTHQRQELPALQTARLRHANGAGRLSAAAVRRAWQSVRDHRNRPSGQVDRGYSESDRRGAGSPASRAARGAGTSACSGCTTRSKRRSIAAWNASAASAAKPIDCNRYYTAAAVQFCGGSRPLHLRCRRQTCRRRWSAGCLPVIALN